MKKKIRISAAVLGLVLLSSLYAQAEPVSRNDYLTYATQAAKAYWQTYDESIKAWADRIDVKWVFGYNPPGDPLSFCYVSANLYRITGEEKYALWAKKVLVEYGSFRDYYPSDFWSHKIGYEQGLPALSNFFTAPQYLKAFHILKGTKYLSKKEIETIIDNIAGSMNSQVRFQEWGAMNRAILRAENFIIAASVLPDHPDAKTWRAIGESILDDCWGAWQIEDAAHYNPIYLYSLISLVDFLGRDDYWNLAVTRYIMQFYTRLLAPHGMIPDFGDADLYGNWHRWPPILEHAASAYGDAEIKYAVNRIVSTHWDLEAEKKSMWLATIAMDCYRWASDEIQPQEPPQHSEKVLDDMVGKKIVFRDGYEPQDTYLLLNYKDEGQAGFLSRDYLRKTICVEEEKMTHGHSDENDITLFMTDGCVLLHDGGYRDYMPSGPFGAYRADYFHNRVVMRKDKLFKGQEAGLFRYSSPDSSAVKGQNVLDFIRNSGAYRETVTELIDFLRSDDFDYSRTRATYVDLKTQHDRIVTWVKPLNIFVVFDAVQFLQPDYYTTVNIWHTRQVLQQGDSYFLTHYDSLGRHALPTHKALLIVFPQGDDGGRMIGTDPEKRYYQDEIAIHQSLSRWHYAGEQAIFTTVLVPTDAQGSDIRSMVESIKMVDVDRKLGAVGVKIKSDGKTYYVCSKLDRDMDLHHLDRRPQYDYEHGKVRYDDFETDGHQFHAIIDGKKLDYQSIYTVKIAYKDRVLFEQPPADYGLQFEDGIDKPGVGKLRYWRDSVLIQ
ncbi:hypothetical protein JW992_09220 [candidate division KSB1 bacterium]|nr:hypothetical protein [candidate division KSB1 bacterium]